ncbi:MAG TPA: hypothetical protein VFQ37_03995 [Mycobacterium sp.]|nr:hypothetical protein [Mycobacterium sp.]
MAEEMDDLEIGRAVETEPHGAANRDKVSTRTRLWVNWMAALATVPAAAAIMIFAFGGALSTAACSGQECPNLGPHGIGFGVLFYGAAVVAAVTLVISFFTAKLRRGVLVPLVGWALLVADIIVLLVIFRR